MSMNCVVTSATWAIFVSSLVALAVNIWAARSNLGTRAEKIRRGLLSHERCTYCGLQGQPVERDYRRDGAWVCIDARACLKRGRTAPLPE